MILFWFYFIALSNWILRKKIASLTQSQFNVSSGISNHVSGVYFLEVALLKFKFEDKYGKELTELDLISVKATTTTKNNKKKNKKKKTTTIKKKKRKENKTKKYFKMFADIYLTSVKSGLTIRHLLVHAQTFM